MTIVKIFLMSSSLIDMVTGVYLHLSVHPFSIGRFIGSFVFELKIALCFKHTVPRSMLVSVWICSNVSNSKINNHHNTTNTYPNINCKCTKFYQYCTCAQITFSSTALEYYKLHFGCVSMNTARRKYLYSHGFSFYDYGINVKIQVIINLIRHH